MKDVAVIGAGISGLSVAWKMREAGLSPVIYEKESDIGGLCRTRTTNGYTFDLSGGHVFNSKSASIKNWAFSLLPEMQWQYSTRVAKISYHDRLIDYPFELALSQLDPEEAIDCLVDFISSNRDAEPDNFHDWLIWLFGASIAEKYMLPYNRKIWNYDLGSMSTDWVRGKMPIPTVRQLITSVVKNEASERLMPHSAFFYPRQGGIRGFVDAIAADLPSIRVGEPLLSLEMAHGRYLINGSDWYDLVINTAPLPELAGVIRGMPDDVLKAIADLKFNSIKTTLFSSARDNDISWVYIPDPAIKPHRIVFQGNFAPNNAPAPDKSSITVEVIGDYPVERIMQEVSGIVPLGGYIDEHFTKYAYVVFDKNRARNMGVIRRYFADVGIELLGRFAEWEYYNMDVCTEKAFALFERYRP